MRNILGKVNELLENLGQTFFISTKAMGLFIVVALATTSSWMLFLAFISVLSCRFMVNRLRVNKVLTLVGFVDVNAFYSGAAVGYFFEASLASFFVALFFGILVAYLIVLFQRLLAPWQLSMFILPFLVSMTFLWIMKDHSLILVLSKHSEVSTSFSQELSCLLKIEQWAFAVLRSYSQIFFSNSAIKGVFLLIGLCFISPRLFAVTLVCAGVSNVAALALGFDLKWIISGLLGFNSILVAAAYLGLEKSFSWFQMILLSLFSLLLTIVLSGVFYRLGFLSLSFPYVMVMWVYHFTQPRIVNTLNPVDQRQKWVLSE